MSISIFHGVFTRGAAIILSPRSHLCVAYLPRSHITTPALGGCRGVGEGLCGGMGGETGVGLGFGGNGGGEGGGRGGGGKRGGAGWKGGGSGGEGGENGDGGEGGGAGGVGGEGGVGGGEGLGGGGETSKSTSSSADKSRTVVPVVARIAVTNVPIAPMTPNFIACLPRRAGTSPITAFVGGL